MSWKNSFKNWLNDQPQEDFEFIENHDLGKSSTLRLKSQADFLKIKSEDFLRNLYQKFSYKNFQVLGKGANSILPEHSDIVFIRLNLENDPEELSRSKETYFLSASTSLAKIITHAMKFGKTNWEVLTGIPGTLGGAIAMNAGTKLGEISNLVSKVRVIRKDGTLDEINVNQSSFSYRKNHFLELGDVITYAYLQSHGEDDKTTQVMKEYMDYRQRTQPLWEKTCGSVFKNDPGYLAGKSIDLAGLKGLICGGLKVSDMHANFIINFDEGNRTDFVRLTNALKQELELTYGISFELEAKFL